MLPKRYIWLVTPKDVLCQQTHKEKLKKYTDSSITSFLYSIRFSFLSCFLTALLSFLSVPSLAHTLPSFLPPCLLLFLPSFSPFFLSLFLPFFLSFLPSFLPSFIPPFLLHFCVTECLRKFPFTSSIWWPEFPKRISSQLNCNSLILGTYSSTLSKWKAPGIPDNMQTSWIPVICWKECY